MECPVEYNGVRAATRIAKPASGATIWGGVFGNLCRAHTGESKIGELIHDSNGSA
jgi:hypothetical protein